MTLSAPRILLVEDEPNLARGVRENLEAEGYAVDVVGDGHAALANIRTEEYGLIVLDVKLPGMDGFTVCETARREGRDTPVLFLTAKGGPTDRIRTGSAATITFNRWLRRPVESGVRALIEVVHAETDA